MAKSATPTLHPSALVDLMGLMQQVLAGRGSVTFSVTGDLADNEYGCTWFDTNEVDLAEDLTGREFMETMAHELVHLVRGPAFEDEAAAEERIVERIANELLYGERTAARTALLIAHGGTR